jgi:hypothetical protein
VGGAGRQGREVDRARAHARAVQRAKQRLAEQHRDEYRLLLEREKAAEGIRALAPREVPE